MNKIFIATPAFDGKVNVQYAIALAETITLLSKNSIETMIRINASGSLLVAERNRLLESFWESDCTHILCIDSDLGWPAQAVLEMIKKDVDFVCGCYPARKDRTFIFRPMVREDSSIITYEEKRLLKMQYVPAGFMLIKREVIQKMRESYPELHFEPKQPTEHSAKGVCLFDTELMGGEFWGEDYVFCRRARECGFDIWCDPVIEFDHSGVRGMLAETLTNDKEKAEKIEV